MTPSARPRRVTITAHAKLNLGLEVVGRRPDGYHELVTVMQAIDVDDELTLTAAADLRLACDDPTLNTTDNLALVALSRLLDAAGAAAGADLRLTKRIPVAAGLGGASSDAAAALLAGRCLWRAEVGDDALHDLAASLGSDVPFFLRGGTAVAMGRGDVIIPLPPLTAPWFVVVAPALSIPRKTATLYRALEPDDLSDGSAVRGLADLLRRGEPLPESSLPNAFVRPLYALHPELRELRAAMELAGAGGVTLSGAGPSHFAAFADPDQAQRVAARLSATLLGTARVIVARPVANPPVPAMT